MRKSPPDTSGRLGCSLVTAVQPEEVDEDLRHNPAADGAKFARP